MRVLIVFNHPYEGSFCNAILNSVKLGLINGHHELDVIHLDDDNFDPVMRAKDLQAFALTKKDPARAASMLDKQVIEYKEKLEWAEHIVFIFPIWWELMPALTKGFIDKLIFPGVAYEYKGKGSGMSSILSNLKGVSVITTMNTPSLIYRLLFGNAIKKALLLGTFWKIGIKNREWINLTNVKSKSDIKRANWLQMLETKFQAIK